MATKKTTQPKNKKGTKNSAAKSAKKTGAQEKKTQQLRLSRDILAILTSILAAVIVAVTIRAFGFGFVVVRTDAMAGTLMPGDIVFVSRSAQPEAGNIVLAGARNGTALRRVAAEPGDKVRAIGGEVYRNGMEIYEPYATGEMAWEIPEQTLADDVYLLLPDNRSYDSALVQSGGIAGTVRAVVWPLSRAGFF